MKAVLIAVCSTAVLALPASALATPGGGYGSQPGFANATSNTPCSGAGAFGAFGTNGDVVHDFGINNLGSNDAPGANGYQTGINNSTLCGQRTA